MRAEQVYNLNASNYSAGQLLTLTTGSDGYWVIGTRSGYGGSAKAVAAANTNWGDTLGFKLNTTSSTDFVYASNTKTAYGYTDLSARIGDISQNAFLIVRNQQTGAAPDSTNPYPCYVCQLNGSNDLMILKFTGANTAGSTLATKNIGSVTHGDYTMRFIANGSNLDCRINGTPQVTATDSSYTTGGIGFISVVQSSSGSFFSNITVNDDTTYTMTPTYSSGSPTNTPTISPTHTITPTTTITPTFTQTAVTQTLYEMPTPFAKALSSTAIGWTTCGDGLPTTMPRITQSASVFGGASCLYFPQSGSGFSSWQSALTDFENRGSFADMTVTVRMNTTAGEGGLLVRLNQGQSGGCSDTIYGLTYGYYIKLDQGNNAHVQLLNRGVSLGSAYPTYSASDVEVKVVCVGTHIGVYINGANVIEATDSSYAAGGVGLYSRFVTYMKDFKITTQSSPTPVPTPVWKYHSVNASSSFSGVTFTPGWSMLHHAHVIDGGTKVLVANPGAVSGGITNNVMLLTWPGLQYISGIPASLSGTADGKLHTPNDVALLTHGIYAGKYLVGDTRHYPSTNAGRYEIWDGSADPWTFVTAFGVEGSCNTCTSNAHPQTVCVLPNGDIIAPTQPGRIVSFNPSTFVAISQTASAGNPASIVNLTDSAHIAVVDQAANSVKIVDWRNMSITDTFGTGMNNPYGIDVDSLGNLYVMNQAGGSVDAPSAAGKIQIYSPARTLFQQFGVPYLNTGYGVVIDPTGVYMGLLDYGANSLKMWERIDYSTPTPTPSLPAGWIHTNGLIRTYR